MTGPADDLQELGESWPGTPKLRFRKTGHQESFLSLPLLFLFCFFFPLPSFHPFLSCSQKKNCGLEIRLPTFDLTALGSLLRGLSCRSQQNCEKEKKKTTKPLGVVVCSAGRGRDQLSDSDGKAFISSACRDPDLASPAPFCANMASGKSDPLGRKCRLIPCTWHPRCYC